MKKTFSLAKKKIENLFGNFLISPNILDHFGLSSYNSVSGWQEAFLVRKAKDLFYRKEPANL
ncbi:MAG: hypothetical protein OXJ52_02255 [Oligoflexia bacterium]|nr:hypothetical protein [Oligoflexia bacterium]